MKVLLNMAEKINTKILNILNLKNAISENYELKIQLRNLQGRYDAQKAEYEEKEKVYLDLLDASYIDKSKNEVLNEINDKINKLQIIKDAINNLERHMRYASNLLGESHECVTELKNTLDSTKLGVLE